MFILVPVVDIRWREQLFEWSPAVGKDWIELSGDSDDDDIAWVIAMLAHYNRVATSGAVNDVARRLAKAKTLILPGGLLARTADLEVAPSCCCGLEGWREWYGVKPGGVSPWLGHNPSPAVECRADTAVLWADGDLAENSPNVPVSYRDIDLALAHASKALTGFAERLADWLSIHAPASNLTHRFAQAFDIT